MLFWNNDYSQGLADHMRPVTSVVRPASAPSWSCVIFRPMDWWSRSDTVHRKYTGLPMRIDRNEYYFALLYIVRQVTVSHTLPSGFGGTPRCFDVLKSHGCHKVACRACVRIPMYSGCKHRPPLWFTENIHRPMWKLSIAISIIDLNVHRWSATKLM